MDRYTITTFEKYSQFSRVADRAIITGLTWEDIQTRLQKAPDHIRESEARRITDEGKIFWYVDQHGRTNKLTKKEQK